MHTRNTLKAAALALAVLAPTAHAAGEPGRDTGVGKVIAAQGNLALQLIRADAAAAVRAAVPRLPAAPEAVRASQPAGATVATGTAVQCAE
jgi:hypothetical protein